MFFKADYQLHESGNYHVTLKLLVPKVSVPNGVFWSVLGNGTSDAKAGSRVIKLQDAIELGFVDPSFWDYFKRRKDEYAAWLDDVLVQVSDSSQNVSLEQLESVVNMTRIS